MDGEAGQNSLLLNNASSVEADTVTVTPTEIGKGKPVTDSSALGEA